MNLDNLKEAINNGDSDQAASIIVTLYDQNSKNFKKTLLLSNTLPEPLNRDFSEEKLNTLIKAFLLGTNTLIEKGIDSIPFTSQYLQITQAIRCISHNLKSNLERLERNEFSNYTLSEQIQMYCIYIEDQKRLSNKLTTKKNYLTGMEGRLAKFEADNVKNVKVSLSDNFEAVLEMADTLFRLLYFKAGKEIEKAENFIHEEISPYNIGSLEEIMHLALQRNLLNLIWGKFKYRDWQVNQVENKVREKFYIFKPISKEEYKKELIGVNRYIYQDHINFSRDISKKSGEGLFKFIEECSKNVDSDYIKSLFSLNKKEYLKASEFTRNIIRSQLKSLDEIYLSLELNGVRMEDILKGFEYLYTIAIIYQQAVIPKFDENDVLQYKKLSPIINQHYIIDHFKEIYGLELPTAEKIIKLFIFKSRSKMDIFSQPLVYVGKNNIVFCPTLIIQMNMVRIIQMLTTEFDIDISDKGNEFERNLRFTLAFNHHIKVNTNKIEFKAYDGKDIEFDFIGMFEDHLMVIEFKHLKLPFSEKQYKNSFDTIKFGIEQVNRRVNVIKNDWALIKERCSFVLPEKPLDDSKIIKLVCTNIFNFSTIQRDGVGIIDSSSLIKFFMAPEIKAYSVGQQVDEFFKRNLWNNNSPTVAEFKDYLKCPIAVEPYENCYEEDYKPIQKVNDDDHNIAFFDYNLVKDPYEFLYDIIKNPSGQTKNIKIKRNSPCPCASGKKYKKCCGK